MHWYKKLISVKFCTLLSTAFFSDICFVFDENASIWRNSRNLLGFTSKYLVWRNGISDFLQIGSREDFIMIDPMLPSKWTMQKLQLDLWFIFFIYYDLRTAVRRYLFLTEFVLTFLCLLNMHHILFYIYINVSAASCCGFEFQNWLTF